jgi:hypothetical protein
MELASPASPEPAAVSQWPAPTVWSFWEGPRPAYVDLCFETIARHNQPTRFLDEHGFETLRIRDHHVGMSNLKLNHKGDFVRAYLLYEYGGIWIDADTICLQPFLPFASAIQVADYIGYREAVYNDIQCGFMASGPKREAISRHWLAVREKVASGREIAWLDLSSYPMNRALADLGFQGYFQVDRSLLVPISWREWELFIVERSDAEHRATFLPRAFCYALYNSCFPPWFKALSREEILNGRWFVSFLFRKALGLIP